MQISLAETAKTQEENCGQSPQFLKLPFCFGGKPLHGKKFPRWGLTLRSAGSMRFRWNEQNPVRDAMLQKICAACGEGGEMTGDVATAVPIELIHSKEIFFVGSKDDAFQKQGDGILTANRSLLPVVTVADCLPIFLYDMKSGVFGVLHSGWKGTGIVAAAIELVCRRFSGTASSVLVALGAHIQDCCYFVDGERASYFAKNFGTRCVEEAGDGKYRLSLLQANLSLLEQIGVPESNIVYATDCTCCNEMFGSFRRQACGQTDGKVQNANASEVPFTVQAAFCGWV